MIRTPVSGRVALRHWFTVLVAAGSAGLCGCDSPSNEAVPRARPPHMVVIVADDLGYGDVGFAGGDLPTPRMDRLARESLILNRFYAAPMCTPARAQLLTGRHAVELGLIRNVKPRGTTALPPGAGTVAEQIKRAGYRTALVGKWHLGHTEPEQLPSARGFDATYGCLRGWVDYFTHAVDGISDWHRDGQPLDEPGYATDLIAAEARRLIEAHDAQAEPLFLFVSFTAPHPPLQAPVAGRTPRETYAAMVASLDRGVGEVLDALADGGLAEDTVVWFLSDNGANPKFGGDNGSLRGGKYSCFDGGVRVPACVRWPGHIEAGTSDEFVGVIDVAPTLLALAGAAPLPNTDGVDVSACLTDRRPAPERDFVFAVEHARVRRYAILRPPFKLVEERRTDGDVTRSLFDLTTDPDETHDLLGTRQELEAALGAILARY